MALLLDADFILEREKRDSGCLSSRILNPHVGQTGQKLAEFLSRFHSFYVIGMQNVTISARGTVMMHAFMVSGPEDHDGNGNMIL